jgi:hypothetical protein
MFCKNVVIGEAHSFQGKEDNTLFFQNENSKLFVQKNILSMFFRIVFGSICSTDKMLQTIARKSFDKKVIREKIKTAFSLEIIAC